MQNNLGDEDVDSISSIDDVMELENVEDVLALIEIRPADAELFQRLGQLYLRADQLEEARAALERSLELDPDDPFTHLLLGNWHYRSDGNPEALARFQRACELLPDEAVAHRCKGDAYLELGQYNLAQEAYEMAIRVDPDNEDAQKYLAKWYACRKGTSNTTRSMIRLAYGNDQAATVVLLASRWLKQHPDDLLVSLYYAEMLYKMTRYDEATRLYMAAIEQFEEARWVIYIKLGNLHRYRGDYAGAATCYQKAIDENPGEATGYIYLGAAQARQGKLKQAEESHRTATRCSDGAVDEAYHNLGLVLRGQDRLAEAAECFRKAIELSSDYEDAIEALQDVNSALALSSPIVDCANNAGKTHNCANEGDLTDSETGGVSDSETIEDVLALIQIRPEDAELYQRLGVLYFEADRLEEARVAIERSLELDPTDPFSHLYWGFFLHASRMFSEALAPLQRAAELMPDLAVAFWGIGNTYQSLGRFNLAQEAFETAVQVSPDDETAREQLAKWRRCRDGMNDETHSMIRLAYRNDQAATVVLLASRWLKHNPDDLYATYYYAEMLYKMTRYDEATRVYMDAIERFDEERWGIYNQLGHLHKYRGDSAGAAEWYQKAIDENPEEAKSYIFLGEAQARQGKLKQAEETHRTATRCPDGFVDEAYHNLGLVLRGQDKLAEAAECFRKAIEICSKYADAIEALQDVESALALAFGDDA